jgi:hypothetical protein
MGGSTTQDPDFSEGHPKRREQDALKTNKSFAGKFPNEYGSKVHAKDQENNTSISDVKLKMSIMRKNHL